MTDANAVLFEPFTIKGVTLSNRIVMAPMTRSFAEGGVPGPQHADYYARRAAGGTGLILSEGTVIERASARNDPKVPVFHGAALDGWKAVIDAVHAAGGKMGPQLWHVGAVPGMGITWEPETPPESPSGYVNAEMQRGIALTDNDIADSIAAWARAAKDAQRLGFDVVEVHGAHGYLIDQFFWSATNRREDAFGGATLPERARYAAAVLRAMRDAVGPDLPIILRVSQWKQQDYKHLLATTPAELEAWLSPLVDAGADMIHCSQRRFWEPEFAEIDGDDGLNFAGWVKKVTGAPTISVGSVGLSQDFFGFFAGQTSETVGLEKLTARMERGEFDLIAVGRAMIPNPDWANQVKAGKLDQLTGFATEQLATLV